MKCKSGCTRGEKMSQAEIKRLDELSSCPFCGKRPYLEGYGNHWWARCGHCGALGPTRIGESAAVEFWNTRKG